MRGCGWRTPPQKKNYYFKHLNKVIFRFHSSDRQINSGIQMLRRQRASKPASPSCAVVTSMSSLSQTAALQRECDLPEGVQKQKYDFSNALMRSWGSHCYSYSSRGKGQQVMKTTALGPDAWPGEPLLCLYHHIFTPGIKKKRKKRSMCNLYMIPVRNPEVFQEILRNPGKTRFLSLRMYCMRIKSREWDLCSINDSLHFNGMLKISKAESARVRTAQPHSSREHKSAIISH